VKPLKQEGKEQQGLFSGQMGENSRVPTRMPKEHGDERWKKRGWDERRKGQGKLVGVKSLKLQTITTVKAQKSQGNEKRERGEEKNGRRVL